MRLTPGSLFALTLLALCAVPALADRESEGETEGGGGGRGGRAAHDVRVRLQKLRTTAGGMRVRVRVDNRGRSAEQGVNVAVFSDADPSSPVWQTATDLRRRGHATWNLVLEVPEGTTTLTAEAGLAGNTTGGDDRPHDNDDDVAVNPAPSAGANERGAAIFVPQCSSCHGADGTGGTVHESIAREGAGDILEAVREGEDGMPRFPGITWQDAQDIAAYLRDPVAPPTDPGTGGGTGGSTGGGTGGTGGSGGTTTPTYTGQVASILSKNCVGCHTGKNAARGVRLDTYATASSNANASLSAIRGGRMPPGGPLSAGDTQLFADWIAGGKLK